MKTWRVNMEVVARGSTTVDAETEDEAREEAIMAGVDFRTGNFTLDEYDETTLEVTSVTEEKL